MTRGRTVAALLVALAGANAGAPAARADEPAADVRRRADETFAAAVNGHAQLGDLDVILREQTDVVGREPLAVRDLYWRPVRSEPPAADAPDRPLSLAERRLEWLRRRGLDEDGRPVDYPLPAADEAEPYPRITALVVDRVRRERRGVDLGAPGPLDGREWAAEILDARARTFGGVSDDQRSPEERETRARRDRATARNRWVALVAVAAFVALCGLAYRRLGRSVRDAEGSGANGGPG